MRLAELTHGPLRRGRKVVLPPAAVSIPAGGTIGLVGVNGAGKSTLFHALAGTLLGGAASLRGQGWTGEQAVGFAPQEPAFPDWLDAADVTRFYGCNLEGVARATSGLLVEELANQPVHTLSVGQRQALAVALALAAERPLTLLDEPFAPLDFRRRFGLARLLRARRGPESRRLVIVSSQSAADLLDTCDWILVLREGRYVHSGAADSLTAGIADPAKARQRFEEAVMALLGAASPSRFRADNPRYRAGAGAT